MLIGACDPMLCPKWGPLQVLHPDCFGEEDCYGQNAFPKIEADLTLEYYPFSAAELKVKSCDQLTSDGALPVCGLVLDNGDSCTATSTLFLGHLSRNFQRRSTPHAPCAMLYLLVPML